jgi:plasmid maintenance system antidote protein VapI
MKRARSVKTVSRPERTEKPYLLLGFGAQADALLLKLRGIVANGIVSERRIAQVVGLSQPHIHHLLSGERTLTVQVADRLLRTLEISPVELLDEIQVATEFCALRRHREPRVSIPCLSGKLGPRGPFPLWTTDTVLVDCHLLAGLLAPTLAVLGHDRGMASVLGNATHAILHEVSDFARDSHALYAFERDAVLMARGMRPGGQCAYLQTGLNWNRPEQWERIGTRRPRLGLIPLHREPGGYYSTAIPEAAAAS